MTEPAKNWTSIIQKTVKTTCNPTDEKIISHGPDVSPEEKQRHLP